MTLLFRSRSLSPIVAAALAISFSGSLVSAQEENLGGGIKEMMTPEQFKAAGLDKLSQSELDNLNRWLGGYRETTVKSANKKFERQQAQLVVSRVDGVFNGLTGGTIVRLEDGTAWKQANSSDRWNAPGLDHPGAAVLKTVFGRKMRISGYPEFYVDPVRQ